MKISIRSLKEGISQAVQEEYHPKALDLEFVDLAYLENVFLDGTVERFRNTITLRGHLKSRVERTCARCLKAVEESVDHPFELVYDIGGKEEVDTFDDIREILILDHPIRFLCEDACLGLCPACGSDLNKGACLCAR